LGRRWQIGDGVFHLGMEELGSFEGRRDVLREAVARRIERHAECPPAGPDVIAPASPGLSAEQTADGSTTRPGLVCLVSGRGQGPGWVVRGEPDTPAPGERYVLICPALDSGLSALAGAASAIVVERGDQLSRAAHVGREANIPVVVLAGATERLGRARRVVVDADAGRVAFREGSSDDVD
jgi:phosphohistidine swiveling domain-containing protein